MPLRLGWTAQASGSQDVRVKREAALNRRAPRFLYPTEIRANVGAFMAASLAGE
jgi:hypothetical protein